jgi:hypothetical protein
MKTFREFLINEYGEDYRLRLLKTLEQGRYKAKIYRDHIYSIFLARYYLDGKYLGEGPEDEESFSNTTSKEAKEILKDFEDRVKRALEKMEQTKYRQN